MRHAPLLIAGLLLALPGPAPAAEGMWPPARLADLAGPLARAGLALPAARLGDLQAAPLNAIVSLGGCSGSFVSPRGLVATNHHCVYGALQYHSTATHNLLAAGFLARTPDAELPAAPGTRLSVIAGVRDVTAEILGKRPGRITGAALLNRIDARRTALISQCEKTPGHRCEVKSTFGGQTWTLHDMLEITDVRLVHAPAGAIGNYGGEVDNWMWPRHTGDYGFYRAYVGPDGQPAPYAASNVPYRPASWLPMASDDLQAGDFVMVAGFPGVTERARTAAEAEFYYRDYYPLQQRLLADYASLITRTATSPADAVTYAAILRGADNYKKKILGQMAAADRAGLIAAKNAQAQDLRDWVTRTAKNRRRALAALDEYDRLVEQDLPARRARLINQTLDRAQYLKAARDLYRWAREQGKPDAARAPGFQARDRQALVDRLTLIDRRFAPAVDRAILEQALGEVQQLPRQMRNMALEAAIADIGLDRLYSETELGDRATRLGWLDQPAEAFVRATDPFIRLAVAASTDDSDSNNDGDNDGDNGSDRREAEGRLLQAGIARMDLVKAWQRAEGHLPYPDANGTLRISYGHVRGEPPAATADAPADSPAFTTAAELLAKDTGTSPFAAPPALLAAIRTAQTSGDWGGRQSARLGTLPVNFLSTTDITNGNSGSAMMNARGEFVGLAFDGTLEGMLSDWAYAPATTRTIAVDWRYMLWVMRTIDKADNLLAEMAAPQ